MLGRGKIISGIPWGDARPIKIASAALCLDIDHTTAASSGTVYAVDIDSVNTTAGIVNYRVLTVDLTMGANCSGPYAAYFRTDCVGFQVLGLGAALGMEVCLPGAILQSGEFHGMTIDMECAQNFSTGAGGKHSFIKFEIWGNSSAKTVFDDAFNLFFLNGMTSAAGNLVSAQEQTLRINIEGTTRYLVLSSAENNLTLATTSGTSISIGTCTTGIALTGTMTNGINITGASSVAQINLAHTMAAYDDQCILVVSSSSATDGSSQAPIKSSHTMTGAGATGGRAEFNCTFQPGSSGAAGGWTNALKANFTFGSNATGGTGLHTALTAEMSVPNATVSGGEFACLDMQMGIPASHIPQAKGLSFFTMNSYTTPTVMDDSGTLFALYGVSGGDNKMFDTSVALNNPQIEAMLRIRILNNYWYIPLCDDPDGAA